MSLLELPPALYLIQYHESARKIPESTYAKGMKIEKIWTDSHWKFFASAQIQSLQDRH